MSLHCDALTLKAQMNFSKILLTRESEDNKKLAHALEQRGIPVMEIPCVATRYLKKKHIPKDSDALLFTSRRGVRGFFLCNPDKAMLLDSEKRPLIGAVGKATARELEQKGVSVNLIAWPPKGEVLANLVIDELKNKNNIKIPKITIIRGNLHAGALDEMLKNAGFTLQSVEVYENVDPIIPKLTPFAVSAVFGASPSAVRRLLTANPWLKSAPFFAIGSTTLDALRNMGVSSAQKAGSQFELWLDVLSDAYKNHQ